MLRSASPVLSGAAPSLPGRHTNFPLFLRYTRCSDGTRDSRWKRARISSRRRISSSLIRMASGNPKGASPPVAPAHSTSISLSSGHAIQVSGAPGLSASEFRNAVDSALFRQWLKNMQSPSGLLTQGQMSLKEVHVQGVDMFGKGVGFLKFKADVIDNETGKKVPGIVFSRGQSVAVLIILESRGVEHVVLTEQVRVPVGRMILELPAGMLDDNGGDVVGTAAREVEEETGISLNLGDMVNLTSFLDPSTGCRIFPSPGACDEEISLFLYKGHANQDTITALRGKKMGLREHGELIKVHVVPYHTLWRITADSKVLSAIALYEMGKREGLLSP